MTNELIQEISYDIPYPQALQHIASLNNNKMYSKTELAIMWGIHRKTIQRWHSLALANCPGYIDGFVEIAYMATCPHYECQFNVSELQRIGVKRKVEVTCPICHKQGLPKIEIREFAKSELKVPGKYAKILRLVGELTHRNKSQGAIAALTVDPDHVKTRQFIRKQLSS